METSKESSGTDKQGLWGWWHSHQQWADRLHRKAAHKALDIEDDAMIVSNKGVSAGGLVGVGLLTMLGPVLTAAAIGYLWYQSQQSNPTEPPAATAPADAGYNVVFYDAEGNEVRLDRWPGAEQ